MYNKSNVIYSKKREATMYRTLLLASVLTTFTLGVSVGQVRVILPPELYNDIICRLKNINRFYKR